MARRLVLLVTALALAATVSIPSVEAARNPTAAEGRMLALINEARHGMGRVALRWDGRLADVAKARSDDMAARNYLAHLPSSQLSSMLNAKGITWYFWGETLAKNNYPTLADSTTVAFQGWRSSAPHWSLLTSVDYNYVAIAVTRAQDGNYYWTALLLKGPDRTPPKAAMTGARLGSASGGKRNVTLTWSGSDVPLSVLTAGLRDFRLQRRIGTGRWQALGDWTTATSRTVTLDVGKAYRFRIRARDRNGNLSLWSAVVRVNP